MLGHEPSEEHIEGLTARPYWDLMEHPQWFPWAPALQASIPVIRQELQQVLQSSYSFASDSVWQNQVMGKGWSAIRLQRLGVWNQQVCTTLFPETYALIRSLQMPTAVRGVCFARQAPYSGVQPHSDGRNFILTIHVPLQIPTGCWIEVAGDRRTWQAGKLLTIDTSFSHSTSNPTPEERYVLIIDVWHPELTKVERDALEFIYDLRNKYEQGVVPIRTPKSLLNKGESSWSGLWKTLRSER
jgi:aspartate beta-hydroxylase